MMFLVENVYLNMNNMNDHNEKMQEIIYKEKRIQFKTKHFPGTERHLTMIADNHFSTREVEDKVI